MKWADERLLAAVPASTSSAMLQTLNHIYRAEAVWLRRVLGETAAQLAHIEEASDPEALRLLWSPVNQGWIDWAAPLQDDASWSQIVPHQDSRGNFHQLPVWLVVMHVVNHGSYHRGQVARMMREEGITPPATDLVIYYRTLL
jgi:uncharacterized damage-inducible protein DinB